MHPAFRVDPNKFLQPDDIHSTMRVEIEEGGDQPEGAATGEEPSTTSASMSKEGDKSAVRIREDGKRNGPADAKLSPKNKAEKTKSTPFATSS